jgi:hypothetical protein
MLKLIFIFLQRGFQADFSGSCTAEKRRFGGIHPAFPVIYPSIFPDER